MPSDKSKEPSTWKDDKTLIAGMVFFYAFISLLTIQIYVNTITYKKRNQENLVVSQRLFNKV